jgi:hypothetical protein
LHREQRLLALIPKNGDEEPVHQTRRPSDHIQVPVGDGIERARINGD